MAFVQHACSCSTTWRELLGQRRPSSTSAPAPESWAQVGSILRVSEVPSALRPFSHNRVDDNADFDSHHTLQKIRSFSQCQPVLSTGQPSTNPPITQPPSTTAGRLDPEPCNVPQCNVRSVPLYCGDRNRLRNPASETTHSVSGANPKPPRSPCALTRERPALRRAAGHGIRSTTWPRHVAVDELVGDDRCIVVSLLSEGWVSTSRQMGRRPRAGRCEVSHEIGIVRARQLGRDR
ncbi:hypothetical protein EDC01DRAFT_516271 [Geopyxis carbonaria]|nr:hypothetical protein EDC01DRAFT_516271 [Geopyxis carbonaria]